MPKFRRVRHGVDTLPMQSFGVRLAEPTRAMLRAIMESRGSLDRK